MFFGFRKRRSLQQMLDTVAACGLSLREGVSAEALYQPRTQWEPERSVATIEKGGFESLLIAMGDEGYDPATHVSLDPPSDDVWYFDVEFIEGHGAYKTIVKRLCRMTRGGLSFNEIEDYVDVEEGVAWVELKSAGRTERIELTVNNDWTDPKIFLEMQERLKATGSSRRFAMQSLGQDCLIVCQTPENLKALHRATGLRFML